MNQVRRRLTKADRPIIVQALEDQGLKVRSSADRVEAWCPETDRYVCGLYWMPARSETPDRPALQACWRLDIALSEVFSIRDLKTALHEIKRVYQLVQLCRAGWKKFTENHSEKRWMEYRGQVATLFLRQKDD